jgi:hypothetical protein
MRIITRQLLADGVVERWKKQYPEGIYHGDDKGEILINLIALGENPPPDKVDTVIGNRSWTRTRCDECGDCFIDIIEVGQDPGYDSATAHICVPCIVKALNLSREGTP